MAKVAKTRKPVSSRTKGCIALVLLLALTVFVSCLAIGGLKLDSEGVNVLLPWVPVSSEKWVKSLPLSRALGGGTYVEYTVSAAADDETPLPELVQKTADLITSRLSGLGEADSKVTVKDDNVVYVELRNMEASRLSSIRSMSIMPAQLEVQDSAGNVLLTEKEIERASLGLNSAHTGYVLTMTANAEGTKALADAGVSSVSVTLDGSSLTSYATVSGSTISISMGTDYSTAVNVTFLLNTGAVDASLTQTATGTVPPTISGVLRVALILSAVLLVAACLYLVITGKLTGVSGIWTVWCAVLLSLFFFATIVIPTIRATTMACVIALILGILLAIFTAAMRTDAISKQIAEGYGPKQATKTGMRAAAKLVWLVHGGALVLALILMIFNFSRATGYSLAAGVVASAFTAPLMRLFQACFIAITKKPSLFGKAK